MDKIKEAFEYAKKWHGDQKYGDEPYTDHLEQVYKVLIEFGCVEESVLIAGILHDVIEDTEVSRERLQNDFTEEVSDLVYFVTNESGKNRRERHDKTYPKILSDDRAIQIKLADRIANVRNCLQKNSGLFYMYRKEHKYFRRKLFRENSNVGMWAELSRLMTLSPNK